MKNICLISIIIIAVCIINVQCTIGVDVSQSVSTSAFACLKNNGARFAIARGYCSFGGIDSHAKATLEAAKSEGLNHDSYHFPCIGKVSPTEQANAHVNYLGTLPGMYWMDIETNPSSGCGWRDHTTNCNFLQELVKAFQAKGVKVGIYASESQWQSIMGGVDSCAHFSNLPLWYPHYDGQQSFSDFRSFGGWKKPTIKQYRGDVTLCGVGVDLNFY